MLILCAIPANRAQMNMMHSLNLIRTLRFRFSRLLGWGRLLRSHAVCSGKISVIGAPVIEVSPGSVVSFGKDVVLISNNLATLGVNHPVVLRTLRPGARITLGDRVGMSGGTICAAQLVQIGDDTKIGANVVIVDTDFHSLNPDQRSDETYCTIGASDVVIGRRVFIGMNSIILKGVRIGDNSAIGAGSVVTNSIPPDSIAAGNPCRVIRKLTSDELPA